VGPIACRVGSRHQTAPQPTGVCDLLAPVYDWFTEGFEIAELKDAGALLDELR
jgi:hypothetical protein